MTSISIRLAARSHGLLDGDRVRLSGVNPNPIIPSDTRPASLQLAQKRAAMFNTVHEVFVSCDNDATSCPWPQSRWILGRFGHRKAGER